MSLINRGGSHFTPKAQPVGHKRSAALVVAVVAIALAVVGGTVAWIATSTQAVNNQFTPGAVHATVVETVDDGVKSNVRFKNDKAKGSNVPAFMRASIVATWVDDQGGVYAGRPVAGTDYAVTWGGSWKRGVDGYWYYVGASGTSLKAVAVDAFTDPLIVSCSPVAEETPAGFSLAIDVMVEAIQATPVDAVAEAWISGVDATGTLRGTTV